MYTDRLEEYAEDLSDEELGKWLRAILLFQKTGEIAPATGERLLDADIRKYCRILEANKANWLIGQERRSGTQKDNARKRREKEQRRQEAGKPRPMKTRKQRAVAEVIQAESPATVNDDPAALEEEKIRLEKEIREAKIFPDRIALTRRLQEIDNQLDTIKTTPEEAAEHIDQIKDMLKHQSK